MIYLSGAVRPQLLNRDDVGLMLTPKMGNNPDLSSTPWAADTGCFADPAGYSTDGYLRWLDKRITYQSTCLFATAPDVWGNGPATLAMSRPVLPLIRSRVKAALVLQPGITLDQIPWDELDAVFTGGPDDWHRSRTVDAIVQAAKARGKWCHRGRVNSYKRLLASSLQGYDSTDGTFVAFAPKTNIPRLEHWLEQLRRNRSYFAA